jgi:hypothetical protein
MKLGPNDDVASKTRTPREQVNEVLQNFLNDPNPGVLALKGAWGIGKTYIWNSFLEGYKSKAKQVGYAYVSLFGINTIAELRQFIFAKHISLGSDKKQKWWRQAKKISPLVIESVDFGLKNTEVFSEWVQDKVLRNFIICIDDLERKEASLAGSALLGFITSLREERKCKVILIYNDAEISEELNKSFGEYREKVIDREVEYSPSVHDNFRLIFPDSAESRSNPEEQASAVETMFGGDNRTLLQLFECLKVTNIRVFQKTKIALEYFAEHLRDRYPKLLPQFARQTVKICCLYFVYGDRWSLERLIKTSLISDYLGNDENDSEKAKERAARQPIRDISYDSKSTDIIIAEFLCAGYVEWSSHESLLAETEKKYEANELNGELSKQWSKFWGDFTTPQDVFVREMQEFIGRHWKSLRLQDVDSATRFLKKIDPAVDFSDILDKRVALFVEQHRDDDPFHLDLHGVDPSTFKQVRSLLISSSNQLPIDEAIDRLTRDGGWSSADVKYLANTTADQFYVFLISAKRPYLLATIKELRSRLASGEDGQIVSGRIDAALRRLAERSKLDELRVQQAGVDLSAGAAK